MLIYTHKQQQHNTSTHTLHTQCWWVDVTHRSNREVTYLTDAEEKKLSRWSEEVQKSKSHLLREAIMEYLDFDRLARIEEKIDRIDSKLEGVPPTEPETTTHTHMDSGNLISGSNALEKARKIIRRLHSNHDDVIQESDVERAIEDVAGIDERTIEKYKDIFRRRGLLFEHPGEPPLWTSTSSEWLGWMQSFAELNGMDETEKVADAYPVYVGFGENNNLTIQLEEVEEVTVNGD